MKLKCVLIFAVMIPVLLHANPMGLKRGMTLDELYAIDPWITYVGNNNYSISTTPAPSSQFFYYVVKIHPEHGLLGFTCYGSRIDTPTNGENVKVSYNYLKERLIRAYGEPLITSEYYIGGAWSSSDDDFMKSLESNGRYHQCLWKDEPSLTANNLELVYLDIYAEFYTRGFVRLVYQFSGHDELMQALIDEEESF